MTFWKVDKYYYDNNGIAIFGIMPYSFTFLIYSLMKWEGLKTLKRCYLFKKQAERKVRKLNKQIKQDF